MTTGTHLKSLLSKLGIRPTANCACHRHAAMMDRLGPDWCEENGELILGWMQQEAHRRSLPFPRLVAIGILTMAIRRARKDGRQQERKTPA